MGGRSAAILTASVDYAAHSALDALGAETRATISALSLPAA